MPADDDSTFYHWFTGRRIDKYWGSRDHSETSLQASLKNAAVLGTLFTGRDLVQSTFIPRRSGAYLLGYIIYSQGVFVFETIHGKQSVLHNFFAAGSVGFAEVLRGSYRVPYLLRTRPREYLSAPREYLSVLWRKPEDFSRLGARGLFHRTFLIYGLMGLVHGVACEHEVWKALM